MAGKRRDAEAISAEVAGALRALVSSPKFELIPLSNALDRAASLPPGATVTVTASPSHGIEATFDLAEDVAALGHEAIPHLSAHMIRGREHLRELLAARSRHRAPERVRRRRGRQGSRRVPRRRRRCCARWTSSVTRSCRSACPRTRRGTPTSPTTCCSRRCVEKQRYASYMATQMCFNPDAITSWVGGLRVAGRDVADPPRRAGRGRDHEADAGRRADRRGGFRALPEEEPQDRRPPALARELRPRRVARRARRDRRRSRARRSSACTCSRSTRSAPPSPGSSACSPSSTRWRDRERGGGRGRYGTSAR